MPSFRVTVFFEAPSEGWTESYYKVASDHAAAYSDFLKVLSARVKLLGVGVAINYVRVADVNKQRDALPHTPRYFVQGIGYTAPVGSTVVIPAEPNVETQSSTALLCRMTAAPNDYGHLFMRGLPRTIAGGGSRFDFPAVWEMAFKTFKATIMNTWGIYTSLAPDKKDIAAIQAPGNLNITVVTVANHGYLVGDRVYVSASETSQGVFRGNFRVASVVNATTFTLARTGKYAFVTTTLGTVHKVVKTISVVKFVDPMRLVTREAGRPFGSPVGRRLRKGITQ